jgi:hypothetical protein
MKSYTLNDQTAIFSLRGVIFLVLASLLIYSPRQENEFHWLPFVTVIFYLATSFSLWYFHSSRGHSAVVQSVAYVWDILVISALLFSSEGFDGELYLMYFLIIFMSGLMSQARQSFLIGTVSSLVYVALWANGKTGEGLSLTSLLLRFAFFYVTSFFTAIMAERVRFSEQRAKSLALRMALGRIANGGWGAMMDDELSPSLDPDLAKSIRTINALMDNLTQALRHTAKQNEDLRAAAEGALLHLAHEKERLGSLAERHYSTS